MDIPIIDIEYKKIKLQTYEFVFDAGNSSVAYIDIAFKDICVFLKSNQILFSTFSSAPGYCYITVYKEELYSYDILDLNFIEIIERLKLFKKLLESSEQYLLNEIFVDYINRIDTILNRIDLNSDLEQIINDNNYEIETINSELFFELLPTYKVVIRQNGFTLDELKNLLSDFYNKISSEHTFNYEIDFKNLTVKY